MDFHDVQLLSEYLDGRLGPAAVAGLESRLKDDAELAAVLSDLRLARNLARAVPQRRAPRNFTLRPGMRGLAAPIPPAFPVLRLASAVATLIFLVTVAVNQLAPLAASRQAAPASAAYGFGGGGPPAEVATPPLPAAAAPAATAPPLLAAAPSAGTEATQSAPDLQAKSLQKPPEATVAPPLVAAPWQWILAGLAVAFAFGAWVLYAAASRKFRRQMADQSRR